MPHTASHEAIFDGTTDLVELMPIAARIRSLLHDHITDLPKARDGVLAAQAEFKQARAKLPSDRQEKYIRVYFDMLFESTVALAALAEGECTGVIPSEVLGY